MPPLQAGPSHCAAWQLFLACPPPPLLPAPRLESSSPALAHGPESAEMLADSSAVRANHHQSCTLHLDAFLWPRWGSSCTETEIGGQLSGRRTPSPPLAVSRSVRYCTFVLQFPPTSGEQNVYRYHFSSVLWQSLSMPFRARQGANANFARAPTL